MLIAMGPGLDRHNVKNYFSMLNYVRFVPVFSVIFKNVSQILARTAVIRVYIYLMGNFQRRSRAVETKLPLTPTHTFAASSSFLSPRGVSQRRSVTTASLDREIERTEQALLALEKTRIKFPGKNDREAAACLEKVRLLFFITIKLRFIVYFSRVLVS